MTTRIQFRRGLASNWAITNPTLYQGELGLELDTNNIKIGDGVAAWNSLNYSKFLPVQTNNSGKYLTTNGTDASWASTTGTGTLVLSTSPTLTTPILGTPTSGDLSNCTNTVGYGLKSATTIVSVSAATAPSAGQVLVATNSTTAQWQTPAVSLPTQTGNSGKYLTTDGSSASWASTTGTGTLVLATSPTIDAPRITTTVLVGPSTAANLTRFPNAVAVVSSTVAGIQHNESHNIGLIAEGTANAADSTIYGIGVYGVGYTNAGTRSGGIVGEGHVSNTTDGGSAIGVRGYSNDTHAGGTNIGLYADAGGSAVNNYALYMNSGDITNIAAQTWNLGGNLTFSGAYTVSVPTLSLTNALSVVSGGTGTSSLALNNILLGNGTNAVQAVPPGTSGNILTSNGNTWVSATPTATLPLQTGNAGRFLATDGTGTSWQAVSSGLVSTPVKTSAYTAAVYELVCTNTTSGSFTVTLPASPIDGAQVGVIDIAKTFGSFPLTLAPGVGATIEGDSTAILLDINGAYVAFVYTASLTNWRLLSIPFGGNGVISNGGLLPTTVKIANYSASSNELVRTNTTSGSFTVTLPASPIDGAQIGVIDIAKTFGSYPLTLAPGVGATIEGDSTAMLLDINGAYVAFVYTASLTNWRLLSIPFGGNGVISNGTVTNVAALTITTTGTDLTSTVATGTTTPVITINVPNASATARGVLTSADWTTFNSKQAAITFGTDVLTFIGTPSSANLLAAITDETGTGNLVFNTNSSLITPTITSGREVKIVLTANNIDVATGSCFTKTITAATTFTLSNAGASGLLCSFILDLTNGGAFTITWWTGVKWVGGTLPTLTASGRDSLGFFTHDGGTTWTGIILGKDLK